MQLYIGGFGKFQHYTVANNEEEAIKNIQEFHDLSYLPVTVTLIDEVDGYKITTVKEVKYVRETKKESTRPTTSSRRKEPSKRNKR